MASSVAFALRKRKRPLRGSASDPSADCAALRTYFASADEVGPEETTEIQHPRKALLLEDRRAKVQRLKAEGNTLAEAGRFRAAMDRWREAISLDGENGVVYELLAQAAMAVGDDFDAVQFALKAVHYAPSWGDAYLTLARCHLNYGELELAYENIEKATDLIGLNDELVADKDEIMRLLNEQRQILERRELELSRETDNDKLQAISCMKHLSLRGTVG